MSEETKVCSICKEEKPLTEFYQCNNKPLAYCKECTSKKNKEYYDKNQTKRKQNRRIYYKENKEKVIEQGEKYQKKNKDKIKKKKKIYYRENKERFSEKSKKYRKENAEKLQQKQREYNKKNKEKNKLRRQKYREENKEKIDAYDKERKQINRKKVRVQGTVQRAIKSGKLIRPKNCHFPNCTETENLEAHHCDYNKPLEVIFLCRHHHQIAHYWYEDLEINTNTNE